MTNHTDPSKEREIPEVEIERIEMASSVAATGSQHLAMSRKALAQYFYQLGAKIEYCRHLHPSPSGWIEIKPGCEMPEYTERHQWFNDETGQLEEYGEPAFQIVLAYNEEIGVFKAKYEKHGRWSEISSCSINGTVKPTHWQPLPLIPGDK
jgi:hypothetical protein